MCTLQVARQALSYNKDGIRPRHNPSTNGRKLRFEATQRKGSKMNTSTPIDSALAFILSSYQTTDQSHIVQAVVKAGKVSRVKGTALPNLAAEVKVPSTNGAKSKGVESTTVQSSQPARPALVLPVKGTYDAKAFLCTIRKAKTRDESIQAIAGYVGWNPGESFAAQDFAARAQALREMRNQSAGKFDVSGPTRQEAHRAALSVKGYVAGMPNHTTKVTADLLGRERLAYDEIKSLRKKQEDAQSETERTLYAGLILVEEERITYIQKEIARLV